MMLVHNVEQKLTPGPRHGLESLPRPGAPGHHQPAELAQLGDQQPDQVVDVAKNVDTGDEDSNVENVDIKLCWLTRTFIPI